MKFLASSRIGYERLFAGLGIDGDESFRSRAQAIREFVPLLREACEAVLARTPRLFD